MSKDKKPLLPITVDELYARQHGLCWLEVAVDFYDGEASVGDIYCTDGSEYYKTDGLLNPSIECSKCLGNMIKGLSDELLKYKNISFPITISGSRDGRI